MATIGDTNWNQVAEIFDTRKRDEIHPSVADNILIAWPVMRKLVTGQRVLDFGCGTGEFAAGLVDPCRTVMGIDPAKKMIEIAEKLPTTATFVICSAYDLPAVESFHCITSSMVFQFISESEIVPLFTKLLSHLKPSGRLVFAVHNPDFIEASKPLSQKFSTDQTGQLNIHFRDKGKIKLYLRTSQDYTVMLERLGMKKIAEETPPFSTEYIQKYGDETKEPFNVPKFLILAFQKVSSIV